MNDKTFTYVPFKRGIDRRSLKAQKPGERRHIERRKQGIEWIPLFRNHDINTVSELLQDCTVIIVPADTPVLTPGEINRDVYVLLSGELAVYISDNFNHETAIIITRGDCIGEFSAIDGKPVSALVKAKTDSRILRLTPEIFWDSLMTLPGFGRNVMASLTERMRRANEQALRSQREQLELKHIYKELDIARQLQISMVPLQRPLFPERHDLEVCGFMEPASTVGGDMFDAFFVDETHLFISIGDVSGHGIASALFMARTIGLLHVLAMSTLNPDDVLQNLNERLCIDNDANIFITLFCGYLDVSTGTLVYSNGGHCAPILITNGESRFLEIPKGALIGAFPGVTFRRQQYELDKGETLFCYTDGITEARNEDDEEFSDMRCQDYLRQAQGAPLTDLLDNMRQTVTTYTGTDTLEDDCTMLALRRL